MNALRAATRLAPRATARAAGSFQRPTAASEFERDCSLDGGGVVMEWRHHRRRGGVRHPTQNSDPYSFHGHGQRIYWLAKDDGSAEVGLRTGRTVAAAVVATTR